MKKPDCVYKIRRDSDGLFSTGGTVPNFTKKGKVWTSMGALKGHLTLVSDGGRYIPREQRAKVRQQRLQTVYAGCVVVTYVVNVVEKTIGEIAHIQWKDTNDRASVPAKCPSCGHSQGVI